RRLRQVRGDVAHHVADAGAADLLVIGEGDVNRPAQRPRLELRYQGERRGEEGLHVGGAAAVEAAVARDDAEGVAVPGLALDRHDVAVSGEHHAARRLRAEAGEEVGLSAIVAQRAPAARSLAL